MTPTPARARGTTVAWIALVLVILVPIGWGLAATFPWDVDNIAPGSVLKAMAERFRPGWFSSYGPVPYQMGALATLPVLAFLRLTGELSHPTTAWPWGLRHPEASMAAIVIAVRLLSVLMALGIVALAARRERKTNPATPAWALPLLALGSATFCYYAHTSNVDMYYLFWLWCAYSLVEADDATRGRLALGAACAALAVTCKEQSAPLAVVAVAAAMARAFRLGRGALVARLGAALVPALVAGLAYALVWQLPFNAAGWWAHHHFIFTEAKYPRAYPLTPSGIAALAGRAGTLLPLALGWLATALVVLAFALRVSWRGLELRAVGCALYGLAFLATIGYVYPRFLLPFALLVFPLAARALGEMFRRLGATRRVPAAGVAAAAVALALLGGPALAVLSLQDPRLAVERWLAANVGAGETIELAGNPQFQARLAHDRIVLRTRADSLAAMPRGPRGDVVLVSGLDAHLFLRDPLVRAAWWDTLNLAPPRGRYRMLLFSPGRLWRLGLGLPVSPEIRVFVRDAGPAR